MATGTTNTTSQKSAALGKTERFIERQLGKTRLQVRLIDLASGLMTLMTGVLLYLLTWAVVDHWLWPLGFGGRWLAFALLLGGSAYYLLVVVVPLLFRPINPIYAARAIEQAEPTLKNSLINFLFFRTERTAVADQVYSALQDRAASDLHRVAIDTVVDRSQAIMVGYVLAGVLALAAAYKILSPKDPFQSVARVATPWAEIARPSRVQIQDVQPGDAEVFQGESVTVSAAVKGHADQVLLSYSTTDGEVDNLPIAMRPTGIGDRFECSLPAAGSGLKQDATYQITAGDATSATFRLRVSPAPNITVAQVEYDYPAYVKRAPETIDGQGDLKGVEGTRVTIHTRANHPIRTAYIEFDPGTEPATVNGNRLPMDVKEQAASQTFVLKLKPNRKGPEHAAYQLRFTTVSGRENTQPTLHQIAVTPDLAPEVEILTPTKVAMELPLDAVQPIEVRGLDPDFGLTLLRLQSVRGNSELFSEALFADQTGALGQTMRKFDFRPRDLGLEVGDRVIYWVTAEDNRLAPGSDSPEPNQTRTREYEFLIMPPLKGDDANSGENEGDPSKRPPNEPGKNAGERASEQPSDQTPPREQPRPQEPEGSKEQPEKGGEQSSSSGAPQPQTGAEGSQQNAEGNPSSDSGGGRQQGAGQPMPGQSSEGQQAGGNTPQDSTASGSTQDSASNTPRQPLHDGEVIEKTLDRMRQQAGETNDQGQGEPQPGESAENAPAANPNQPTNGGNSKSPAGSSHNESGSGQSQDKPEFGDQQESSQTKSDPQQPGQGAKHSDANQGAGAQQQGATGEGGQSQKNGAEPDRGQKPKPPGPTDMRKKDPGAADNGDSGAGQNSEETTNAGSVEAENRDRPKSQPPDSSEPQPQDDPGFTKDKKQSDSKGQSSGDRSGGGKKGPGQGANQAGNDSAGQNNAADDGAGKAAEAGNGETSNAPGQKQRTDGQTGSAGNEEGAGSGSRSDPSGNQPGNTEQPQQSPPSDKNQDADERQPSESSQSSAQPGGQGVATGGGLPSDNSAAAIDKQLEVPPGDGANLEYARRATNLVLEYLKDQQDNPDPELLKELGWTEQELTDFVKRWQQLKQAAAEDQAGSRELDNSLRSLGLQPQRDRRRQGTTRNDEVRGLRDSGSQSAPPPAYRDLFDAFKKGAARTEK